MNIPKPFLFCLSFLIALCALTAIALTSSIAYANAPLAEPTQGPAMIVTRTVGTDPATCAPTNEIRVVPGTPVYECLTVTNSGTVSLTVNTGIGSPPFMFDLQAGETQTLSHLLPVGGQFVFMPTVSRISTVTLSAVGARTVISDSASTRVNVIGFQTPHIAFAQTLGTEEGSCATTDSLEVEPNTLVYPCFILANRLSQPITVSLLSAPKLGLVPPFVITVPANESVKWTELQGLTGTFGFTATASTNSFATINYNISSSTFSSITAIARIDVLKSMIHLPFIQNQLESGETPNAQSSPTCSPLSTTGTSYEFTYENIPVDSVVEQDGVPIETISGNGIFDASSRGAEDGTQIEFIITNGGVTIANCGSVGVASPPSVVAPLCSPLPTAGSIFDFAYENIPADSVVERDGAAIETISGNGTFRDTPGTESGTMHTYTITNAAVTIVDCGTVTVANGPEIP